ncbi:hypothetical protein F2Q69_00012181 [Brassica cretica]|uniref:DUF4283 domain-containing protein n=1 Tax=Brassica cretica TaxID=69181 RepID=A0A8S9R5G7_BRACR|nr:hypothetical protein F2Q69_00012181 [Brassica cretica]
MSSPENPWLSPGRLASVLNPSSSTSELSTTSSSTDPHLVSDVTMSDSVEVLSSSAEDVTTNSNTEPILITIPPKNSSPILTNKAYAPSPSSTKPLASKPDPNLLSSNRNPIPIRSSSNPIPKRSYPNLSSESSTPKPSLTKSSNSPPSYASKVKLPSDRSLSRLAPTSISPAGKPRVLIPDVVFERGAALHKEYIVGSFLGKMPDYGPIQSVLNYMWGKGSKLEIHLMPLKHSILVRVPNEFIRSKILEKKLWYVDTSMFYVSQWGSNAEEAYPEITSIPLWAHIRGIPFDLQTKEGLSLAAVEANLQAPLSSCGELVRESAPPVTDGFSASSPSSNEDPVHLSGYSPHVSMDVAVVEKSPIPSDTAPDVVNLAPSVDVADELPPPTEPLKADEPNPLPVVTAESQEIAECTIDAFEFPLVTSPPSSPIRSSVFPFTPDPLSPQSPQLP